MIAQMRTVGAVLGLAILLGSGLIERSSTAQQAANDWEKADPKAVGLDVTAIEDHRALCECSGADACLVAYKGKIVSEWYGPQYKTPIYTMSSIKSWTSVLSGMLIADGKIKNVDEPVSKFVPKWSEGPKAKVTIRHLLTMTSGLKQRLGREPGPDQSVGSVSDKNEFVIGLPLNYEPGERWSYSNEGAQLLSPVLEAAAGVPLADYAKTRLFEPLGMTHTRLSVDPKGHAWTYADAETTLRDFAKIGQLMLQRGKWGDRQIVPESWVRESTQACPQNGGYAYLWWLHGDPKGFAAHGYRDTNCYVFPELELVVVRMQNTPAKDGAEPYEPAAHTLFRRMVPRK
jgi:CubicO group peptidase (beta-lactamase class C family)